jgi:hypothetical protein
MTRPRDIGTAAETAVVRVLRANGFPQAERRSLRGQLDAGDITGTPGLCWEVKGGEAARTASDHQVGLWLAETETERVNAGADIGILVVQRRGIGAPNAHRWWAITPYWSFRALAGGHLVPSSTPEPVSTPVRLLLGHLCEVLRGAGYGQPLDAEAVAG